MIAWLGRSFGFGSLSLVVTSWKFDSNWFQAVRMTQAADKIARLIAQIQERFPRFFQRMVERVNAKQVGEGWDVQSSHHTTVVVVCPIQ